VEEADEVGALALEVVKPILGDVSLIELFVGVVVPHSDAVEGRVIVVYQVTFIWRNIDEPAMRRVNRLEGFRLTLGQAFLVFDFHYVLPDPLLRWREADHPKVNPARMVVETICLPFFARRGCEHSLHIDFFRVEGINVRRIQTDSQLKLLVETNLL